MEDERLHLNIVLPVLLCAFIILFVVAGIFCFHVSPKADTITFELGTTENEDLSLYLTGAPFVYRNAELDLSLVDFGVEGIYPATISYKEHEFTYEIQIVDTVSPTIIPLVAEQEGTLRVYELGMAFSFCDFVSDVSDASGILHLNVYVDDILQGEEAKIKQSGEHHIGLLATDGAGNTSSLDLQILVEDTLPPEISLWEEPKWYATNVSYRVQDFVKEISDLSGEVYTFLQFGETKSEEIMFSDCGQVALLITASDEAGHQTQQSITVNVDEAPRLIGCTDQTFALDSELSLSQYVYAVDNEEGFITERIQVDEHKLSRETPGDYEVVYRVFDQHGLCTEQSITVHVDEALEKDSLQVDITNEQLRQMVDLGYFLPVIAKESGEKAACEAVYPALINLYLTKGSSWTAGSGFIYRIDDAYVYIVTVGHVADKMNNGAELTFCDRDATKIIVAYSYERLSAENEIAMFRISTDSIPTTCLLDLREIYADPSVYQMTEIGDRVIAYSGHWQNGGSVCKNMVLLSMEDYFVYNAQNCVVTTDGTIGGMSGTPLFDLRGRVLGIVEGRSVDLSEVSNCKGYHLRIDDLEELYLSISS